MSCSITSSISADSVHLQNACAVNCRVSPLVAYSIATDPDIVLNVQLLIAVLDQLRVVAISTMNNLDLRAERRQWSCRCLLRFVEAVFSVGHVVGASNPLQDEYQ